MEISFIIPAYNEENRIGTCLDSIEREIAREKCSAEIVVVNNASTDHTKEAALAFPGVRVVDEPHKGITWARQAGFNASSAPLVANVDADVIIPEGWLRTVLRAFAHNKKLIAISGPVVFYDLPPFSRAISWFFQALGWFVYLLNRFVLNVSSQLQGGNYVARRDALEKIGGFDKTIEFYGEDTDIARRLHPLGDVVWTFRLTAHASGRRLATEGLLTMAFKYPLNYLSTAIWGKPIMTAYIDVRTEPKKSDRSG